MQSKLHALGFWADVDNSDNTLPKKVRNGEISQYNFILGTFLHYTFDFFVLTRLTVLGEDEQTARAVNIRNRDDAGEKKVRTATVPLDDFIKAITHLRDTYSQSNKLEL